MHIYVVKPGDTLSYIARRYGVTIDQIAVVNQLPNPNQLVVGESLVIPAPEITYTVQSGDTLAEIAQRFGVNINLIIAYNYIQDPSMIEAGQILYIPTGEIITHTVRRGETLYQIARRYGTTIIALAQANGITDPAQIQAGQVLRIVEPVVEVNGYLAQTGTVGSRVAAAVGEYLTYMSMFSYHILADGGLIPINDVNEIRIARAEHAAPLMVITNFSGRRFSPELAHSVLSNPTARQNLINNVLNTMRDKGFIGLNIDFEYVLPADRTLYNEFLREVVVQLRPQGYLVSTALAPKESANQIGLLYEAHDYPVHGQLADFVVLMTYEWGYAAGPPWAIAPINKVRNVLNYAVTAIPPRKILMGMPLYGRDWRLPYIAGTTIARTISPPQAVELAVRYGVPIRFNELYQSPTFRYVDEQGATHEVWFEDARSVQAKYQLVKEYNLRGVSYWELTSEFPQNWPVLLDNFQVRRRI